MQSLLLQRIRGSLPCNTIVRRYSACQSHTHGQFFDLEFQEHSKALRNKWLKAPESSSKGEVLSRWRFITAQNDSGEIPDHIELSSLKTSFEEANLSLDELRDSIELLTLWPNAIQSPGRKTVHVPTREDTQIRDIKGILKCATMEHCFHGKRKTTSDFVRPHKLDTLDMGYLWSFINQGEGSNSVQFCVACKLCAKEGGKMLRYFRGATPEIYLKLLGLLSRLKTVPSDLYKYYLIYKFHDLYDSCDIIQKTTALIRLAYMNMTLYKENEMAEELCLKIINDLPDLIATQGSLGLRSALMVIRPLINEFPHEFKSMNNLRVVKDENSFVYLHSHLIHYANTSSINRACEGLLRKSKILDFDVPGIINVIGHKHTLPHYKEELILLITNRLKSVLSSGTFRNIKNTTLINAILMLTFYNCLDEELFESFITASHLYSSRGIPHKKFAYGSLKSVGFKLATIDCYRQLFADYQSPQSAMSRFRLRLSSQTISMRNEESESLRFMQFREHFLQIKESLIEKIGDPRLVREVQILPHHSPTQLIFCTRNGSFEEVPEAFDAYEYGDIKRPIQCENIEWHALSFSTTEHKESMAGTLMDEKFNSYFKCLQCLGFKVASINLEASEDLREPSLTTVMNSLNQLM